MSQVPCGGQFYWLPFEARNAYLLACGWGIPVCSSVWVEPKFLKVWAVKNQAGSIYLVVLKIFDFYLGRWSNLTNNYFLSGLKPLPRCLWMDDICVYIYIWLGSTPQRGQWKKWRFRGLESPILQMESTVTGRAGVVPIWYDLWYNMIHCMLL